MTMTDWKDALANLKNSADLPDGPAEEPQQPAKPAKKETLHVLIDKKQRKGKTATIVEGFLCDDDEVAEVARKLKQKLGTGGSSRGGEILLQGDWKEKTKDLLKEMGYSVKG